MAGWDETEGPQVYTVGSGGTVTNQKFAMAGSGSYVIHGFVDTNFRENMTRQQAEDFVIKGKFL
jgi:20S proteasome subunit beta 1